MAAVAIAGVGMMMMCISSSVAALVMGGEEKKDPDVPKPPIKKKSSPDDSGSDDEDAAAATATATDDSGADTPIELDPTWKKLKNKKLSGGTFLKFIDENDIRKCKTECFEDKDCKGFSFKRSKKKCALRGGDFTRRMKPGHNAFTISRNFG